MKQTITISIDFFEQARGVKIDSVYQVPGGLIVVVNIIDTGLGGEALCTYKNSITVKTNSDNELPVSYYLINNTGRAIPGNYCFKTAGSKDGIEEIKNIQALPIARPSSAPFSAALFASKGSTVERKCTWEQELDLLPKADNPVANKRRQSAIRTPVDDVEYEIPECAPM